MYLSVSLAHSRKTSSAGSQRSPEAATACLYTSMQKILKKFCKLIQFQAQFQVLQGTAEVSGPDVYMKHQVTSQSVWLEVTGGRK